MRILPNETKRVVRENRPSIEVDVWNRTDKTIRVYYTSRGVEVSQLINEG